MDIITSERSRRIIIGIQGGRAQNECVEVLKKQGFNVALSSASKRCLQFKPDVAPAAYGGGMVQYTFVKPRDVGQWLIQGIIDVAVCFDDTLHHLELKRYELKPLFPLQSPATPEFAVEPRLCVCGRPGVDLSNPSNRIIVEYEDAQRIFDKHGIKGSLLIASGSSESAICSGLADLGLMIVQSGETLKCNGLIIYKEIREIKMGVWVNTGRPNGLEIFRKLQPTARVICLAGFLAPEVAASLSADPSLWSVVITVAGSLSEVTDDELFLLLHDELDERAEWLRCAESRNAKVVNFDSVMAVAEAMKQQLLPKTPSSAPEIAENESSLPSCGGDVVNIDDLTEAQFEAMPLVIKGESKEVRYAGKGFAVIRFLPTIYSFTQNRAAEVKGSEELRLRADLIFLELFKAYGVPHVYEKVNTNWVLSRLVMPHPIEFQKYNLPLFTPPDLTSDEIAKLPRAPPIEIIIKTFHGGTSKHRYRCMQESRVRNSHPLWPGTKIMVEEPYPAPLVRFDWRNPLTMKYDPLLKAADPGAAAACNTFLDQLEGFKNDFKSSFEFDQIKEFLQTEVNPAAKRVPDEILPEPLAKYFIDVDKARQTALNLYHVMATFLESCDVVCNDVCLFITEDGSTVYGEISQDCGRFRHFDLGSLDKDVWRAGGSSTEVLNKWRELSRLLEEGWQKLPDDFPGRVSIVPPSLAQCRPLPSPLFIGTTNPYKISEISSIFCHLPIELIPTKPDDVDEPYFTYLENARTKALAYAERTGGLVLSDDSGISIRALGGLPGPRSARFDDFASVDIKKGLLGGLTDYRNSGRSRDEIDEANNRRVLQLMNGMKDRAASFHVAYVVAVPGRVLFETESESHGSITYDCRGQGGFGYDPIFLGVDTSGSTYAELDQHRKNLRSHRRRALRKVARFFVDMVSRRGTDD